ncbi:glycine zipper 2TM domain-containing protein [Kingella negevensis]|uniref:Lipoprotein n=1 Tax=Kingella negevensis TaxID=1522312 RepID=A0A238HGZ3_9NEIS|nr:glycine zipper 2TM domain-containing protein [Kingella negevensis]MDK4679577.1 glycine zipper 2TM domain-containing protein [Kingella negevensis]MDK4682705.1 glycine zipper 2TM domain-containing protein [Kingella negevensis]MDK4685252.1 glycine zipper 2TM domain-containing protein [Kingella negevensis]MDK4689017.1 glycine zipper 2TM domain-containing protein [Kingella negevensis]MDK4690902.1 glycine zipper 2TM domain-containing protein [Kingella negevensis]
MKSILTKTVVAIAIASSLGACSSNKYLTSEQANTAAGAVIGGIVGNAMGDSTGATLGGAALGGVIGSQIKK